MKIYLILPVLFFLSIQMAFAQVKQVIRGTCRDKDTHSMLPGCSLRLYQDTLLIQGVLADEQGNFRFQPVPVGRYTLVVRFPGYQELRSANLILTSGKELVLPLEMEESFVRLEDLEINATRSGEVLNEMAVNSASSFRIENTERYAGSRSDAARMASNFAGVSGADDSRNDISVRGNSPLGLLWRIEGVDVYNPNHFAVPGTTGGAISILNNKLFGTSDFFTGAFPAEYGNATAAVFDIRLRNGNAEKHEYSAQFGVLGTELSGEGPISRKHQSSYLFAYRYSTLKFFESLKIPIGTSSVPNYQDLSFKLNFPTAKAGVFSVWAISGISSIILKQSDKPVESDDLYNESDWDQNFKTRMYVSGISHSLPLGKKALWKSTLSHYGGVAIGDHQRFIRDSNLQISTLFPKVYFNYQTQKTSLHSSITRKFAVRHTLKTGVILERLHLNYLDSNFVEPLYQWEYRNDFNQNMYLFQGYLQWKYHLSEKIQFNAGVHAQYFTLSSSRSAEPRAGIKYQMNARHGLSLSTGFHSQMLPLYLYASQKTGADGRYFLPNAKTGFSRSVHQVLGYDYRIHEYLLLRIETYYQRQYQVPVDTFASAFSMLNQGTSFTRYFPSRLQNTGTGNNYGIEFTLSKTFHHNWYGLLTASFFESNYKGSDGINRPTDLNGGYILNLLGGKEWKTGKKENHTLITGFKSTFSGGRRYSPADRAASDYYRELVEIDSLRNSLQFRPYFRLDIKIGYRINRPKVTHELALDIINVLNRKNILSQTYVADPSNPALDPIRRQYQLGLLPVAWYRLDF